MRVRISAVLLTTLVVSAARYAAADEPAGSNLPSEKNACATCHGEKDLWEGENARLFISAETHGDDAHWKNGINCHDCHGGDPSSFNVLQAHAAETSQPTIAPFRPALSGKGSPAEHVEAVVAACGRCHSRAAGEYAKSVHGHGLHESGLVVTAVCINCHGSHGIYPAKDARSKLHPEVVGTTCAECHRFIQEQLLQSVHGPDFEPPAFAAEQESTAAPKRKPSCTDCHQGHDLPHPESEVFRLALPERCGSCHAELSSSYTRSLHGQLTELGYLPAAKCSDCHGSHDILPVSDPASRLSAVNRRDTCSTCHPNVNDNFLDYDPHADPGDVQRSAILYWVNLGLTGLLTGVFCLFGLHSLLWFVRSLPHVTKHGRPKKVEPGTRAFVRFRPVHRVAHAVLMTSFLGLALTGLPLRFSNYAWAQAVSWIFGGFSSTGLWHRIFGTANFCCLAFYVLWFAGLLIFGPAKAGKGRLPLLFGPDSIVPKRRDFTDFAKMVRWFLGRGPKPTFDRWTYWEKFDIWAASCDIILIGTTGLILWFPNQFCSVLPGHALNVADLIHGKLALLATGFVFAIHFFSANLRPEKFPMDTSIMTGVVSEEELEEERPDLVRRLRESGELEQYLVPAPSRPTLTLTTFGGFVALSMGLALLAAIVVALFH